MTLHAGEMIESAKNIRTAVKYGARRIGHGHRLILDEDLIKEVIEK